MINTVLLLSHYDDWAAIESSLVIEYLERMVSKPQDDSEPVTRVKPLLAATASCER